MKDAIMVLLEPHEWRLVIDSLMLMRKTVIHAVETETPTWEYPWGEHEIEHLMWSTMLHIGLPDAKRVVPEAYAICFPEGPPRIVGTYGKYRE